MEKKFLQKKLKEISFFKRRNIRNDKLIKLIGYILPKPFVELFEK